jgi:hypothetical protein
VRRGIASARNPQQAAVEVSGEEPHCHRKPSDAEWLVALQAAEAQHAEARDPKYLGKTLLYLDQRCAYLKKVLDLAERFLVSGQDEHVHALLLRAIHSAKRIEENAAGAAAVPFPLE